MLWWVVATGCRQPAPGDDGTGDDSPSESGVRVASGDTSVGSETATTGTTAATGDTGRIVDCSGELPAVPFSYDTLATFETAEDFDFDADGYLCTIRSGNLGCRDQAGDSKVVAAGVGTATAGTRVLPTGDWVVADAGTGTVDLVDAVT